jgi:2-polyprenyl-3-methyl-5-hydroxy-6-metoxy-1,4-benzoquinol methylase
VLDVGCATGGLLYRLRLKGFENLTGIDPSPACAALASSQYQINVLTHTISELHETRNKYDFIILVGVLEHIRDLILHLDLLHNLLSENGRVFVEVPNALHFDGWPDAPYQQFSMEHINFFSPISVQNMMSKSVFRTVHIEELVRAQSLGTMMPVVAAIFEHTTIQEAKMHKCEQTGPSLTRYIQYSETIETRLQQTLTKLADSQKPILVWGTGTHTLHLMETTALSKVKIIAFIDSNPRYQNKAINGIPVIAPLDLPNYSLPILISSRVFQNDIVHQIRKNIGAQNDLILLYNDI